MSIVEDVTKKILRIIPDYALFDSEEGGHEGIRIDPYGDFIEGLKPTIEEILSAEIDLLGSYEPMNSPGKIVLYVDKLASFFWQLAYRINCNGYYMEKSDLERMAHMVVLKTYTHEQFHHFSDVAQHLFGGKYDRNLEEALAVAWSRQKLQEQRNAWRSKEARLSSPFYNELMINMFRYTAHGYRDWVLYQSEDNFLTTVAEYLGGPQKDFLEKSGIGLGRVLLTVLEEVKDKGVVEQCL